MKDNTDAVQRGYALHRLELYNWGTFHERIWSLAPMRETALLTGANGSGKSTVVDALLTLLVRTRDRTYNQASGKGRDERNEKSYVRGAYSRLQNASGEAQTQYLRDENSHSILLAVFHSPGAKPEYVSLAQVFTQGGASKFFVVAKREMSIAEHFTGFETVTALKRRLRTFDAEWMDQFNEYSAAFRRLLHLSSEKALDLFNQTVSLKEVGSLNQFIRNHMLERANVEDSILQLRKNYDNLTKAHEAIVRAERQQSLLLPIQKQDAQHEEWGQQIHDARQAETLLPVYIAWRRWDLLFTAIEIEKARLAEHKAQFDETERTKTTHEAQRDQLKSELDNDEVGRTLLRLRNEVETLKNDQERRRTQARRYETAIETLGLPRLQALKASDFYTMRTSAETELATLAPRIEDARRGAYGVVAQLQPKTERLKGLEEDVASLKQRRSPIVGEPIRVRELLSKSLDIAVDELPFAGELVRVREQEADWEGALERLLHGFALNLLVPEAHYKRISQWVNKNNLGTKLVYQRIEENIPPFNSARMAQQAVYRKLEFKPETTFGVWLQTEIGRRFNYVCCETIEDFRQQERAITVAGQIRHDSNRHEKDDRRSIHDRSNFVLGWDNKAKIAALETQLGALNVEIRQLKREGGRFEKEQKDLAQRQRDLDSLLTFVDYADLDWRSIQSQIELKLVDQRQLEQSSQTLQKLKEQLDAMNIAVKGLQDTLYQLKMIIGTAQDTLKRYENDQRDAEHTLLANPPENWQNEAQIIGAEVVRLYPDGLMLDNLQVVRDRVQDFFRNRAQTYQNQRNRIEQALVEQIANFRNEFRADTESIGSGLGAVPGLIELLGRIEHDQLPSYRAKFKELLDKKMIDNILVFRVGLERQTDDHRDMIARLNTSLVRIPYEPAVYVELEANSTIDREVSDFRAELRATTENAGLDTPDANERAFERIQSLIRKFETEERWTKKVTDVRNWLDFAAVERWRADNSQKRYHNDSSGMSGGQKAKLAYTVLASALAYQYGTDDGTTVNTFRFVVIDEAFSKVDDSNARYAMDLFTELGLQLLVVTPMDKIQVVEPYARAYHLVVNNDEGSESRVLNLTVEEYRTRKVDYARLTALPNRGTAAD